MSRHWRAPQPPSIRRHWEPALIQQPFGRPPTTIDRAAREVGLRLDAEQRAAVVHEQLRMVLQHTRFGTLAATAFAVLLAFELRDTVPAAQWQGWLAVKLLVAAARIALAHAHARWGSTGAHQLRWERAVFALLALDGLVWGVAGWRLSGESVEVAALAVAALDGVSCVATFGLQVRLAATTAYVLPILLPLTWGLAVRDDDLAHFAAAGQLILLGLLLATARSTARRLAIGILLRRHADRLVAEKDAALRLAGERAVERDRFLAKVSHELRTPLHGILGVTRLMQLEAQDPLTARRLALIESSGAHLQGLINDLLDASVLDAGQFILHDEPFDLSRQLDEVAEIFALRAAEKGLGFELHSELPRPCWVRGDASRLRQVLHNLLGNAVKFTEHGGVSLLATPGGAPGAVRMTVRDTGPGLADIDLERIFQPFQQVGPSRLTDGVGLGLTIARELAVAMGGDVRVDSRPGGGSSFHFDAVLRPAAAPDQMPATGRAAEEAGPLPGLVLLAEDDEVNATIAGAFLDSLGVRHERVADGAQAVERALAADRPRPDLVLMDCRMPVLDGRAATQEIRRQEALLGLPRLPILALTATDSAGDRAACLAAGMDGVLGKPFRRAQLAQALRDAATGRAPGPRPPAMTTAGPPPG